MHAVMFPLTNMHLSHCRYASDGLDSCTAFTSCKSLHPLPLTTALVCCDAISYLACSIQYVKLLVEVAGSPCIIGHPAVIDGDSVRSSSRSCGCLARFVYCMAGSTYRLQDVRFTWKDWPAAAAAPLASAFLLAQATLSLKIRHHTSAP